MRRGPGPAGALAEARARVGELADLLWSARADREVVEVAEEVRRLEAALAAVEATAVAEAEARDLARRTLHYGSTGDWLTHVGGLRRGEGRGLVRRALAVIGPLTRTPWDPGVWRPEDIAAIPADRSSSARLQRFGAAVGVPTS